MIEPTEITDPTALYRHYDSDGRLLYIGITCHLPTRARLHATNSKWWPDVDPSRSRVQWFPNRQLAETAERAAIKAERPIHNKNHRYRTPKATRQAWTPVVASELQLQLREIAASRFRKLDEDELLAYDAARKAHESGVPMEDLAEQTGRSRATLFRHIKPKAD